MVSTTMDTVHLSDAWSNLLNRLEHYDAADDESFFDSPMSDKANIREIVIYAELWV